MGASCHTYRIYTIIARYHCPLTHRAARRVSSHAKADTMSVPHIAQSPDPKRQKRPTLSNVVATTAHLGVVPWGTV